MEIKQTILGYLIYASLSAHALAFLALLVAAGLRLTGRPKAPSGSVAEPLAARVFHWVGMAVFSVAFGLAVAAWNTRWIQVGHVPMQNLFEVFLCLGVGMLPLSLFSRYVMRVRGQAGDALLGAVLLFPAGFIFSARPQHLPPALQSWLFVPHVASYMLAYVVLGKAVLQAILGLIVPRARPRGGGLDRELASYRLVRLGFPLLTLGLILGSVWGKIAWGDYWNWDPKELWSLATWAAFLVHLHFRYTFGRRFARINCLLVILGGVAVVVTLLWVSLGTQSVHAYGT